MTVSRRQLVGSVGASLATAGCLSMPGASPDGPEADPASRQTASTAPGTAPTSSPTPAVDVPPCPTKPDPLTADAAAFFATDFEVAYVTRTVLAEHDDVAGVDFLHLSDPEVIEERDAGYVVQLKATYTYGYHQYTDAEVTAIADIGPYRVGYLVGPDTTKRAMAHDSTPDPVADGTAVTCRPASAERLGPTVAT